MKTLVRISIAVVLLFVARPFAAMAEDSKPAAKHWYQITYNFGGQDFRDLSGSSVDDLDHLMDSASAFTTLEDITYVNSDGSAHRAAGVARMLLKSSNIICVQEWTGDPMTLHPSANKESK